MNRSNDNGRGGRPKVDNPKLHLPRVRCYENTLIRMEKIAEKKKRNLCDVYQEALDFYLRMEEKNGLSVTL